MDRLWIIGAGSEGHVLKNAVERMGYDLNIEFIDPTGEMKEGVLALNFDEFFLNVDKDDWYIIAVGDTYWRWKLWKEIYDKKQRCEIGKCQYVTVHMINDQIYRWEPEGNIIHHNASIHGTKLKMSHGNLINRNATICHDCRLASFTHIGPGAVLCGNVTVGERSFIGANATIPQNTDIPSDRFVKAGSVVTDPQDLPKLKSPHKHD